MFYALTWQRKYKDATNGLDNLKTSKPTSGCASLAPLGLGILESTNSVTTTSPKLKIFTCFSSTFLVRSQSKFLFV